MGAWPNVQFAERHPQCVWRSYRKASTAESIAILQNRARERDYRVANLGGLRVARILRVAEVLTLLGSDQTVRSDGGTQYKRVWCSTRTRHRFRIRRLGEKCDTMSAQCVRKTVGPATWRTKKHLPLLCIAGQPNRSTTSESLRFQGALAALGSHGSGTGWSGSDGGGMRSGGEDSPVVSGRF